MNKKLLYLVKLSLRKKIKTKWFLIANILFGILIILFIIKNYSTVFVYFFQE